MTTRVALVTGGNRGIGLEVCRQLAGDHGLKVFLGARDPQAGEDAAAGLAADGLDVTAVELDVTDHSSTKQAIEQIDATAGRLDVLVNNAGILDEGANTAADPDMDAVRRVLDVNVFGLWWVTIHALPLMRASSGGDPDVRTITNVSSGMGALDGMASGNTGYRLSKTAVNNLTLQLADELDGDVLVNSVCPGWVRTDMGGPDAHRDIATGAKSVVWAAALDANGPTGGFFRDGNPINW